MTLQKLQRELLQEAWSKVRPGGFLAYSVCSVFKDEGPRQLERAEGLRSEGELVKSWAFAPQEAPFGDGFWGALVRKRG